jgi:uncharacterized membrane protein (DUF485 family)
MTRFQRMVARARQFAFRAAVVGLVAYFWLLTSPLVLAAGKKKAEAPAETKSYTMPYLIVIMVISMGLMTICRPSRRADKPEEKRRSEEELED